MHNPIAPAEALKKVGTWFDRMEKAGLQFEDLQLPIDDRVARERIADFWHNGAQAVNSVKAEEIMGCNYLPLQKWLDLVKPNLHLLEERELSLVPFSEATLMECRDTHYLLPGCTMTAMETAEKFPETFFSTIYNCFGGDKEVTENKVRLSWYLVRKQPIVAEDKDWHPWRRKQTTENPTLADWRLSLVPEKEFMPSVAELVYCIVLCYKAFGVDILQDARVLGFDRKVGKTSHGMATIHGRMGKGTLRLDQGGESGNSKMAVLTCRKPLQLWPFTYPF